jgi:NAD(P)-dependent dehydrogenase (short-subunit alcohol dehydrogenase family)
MKFKDKKVVIAGGTSGIGLASAKNFLAAGARVTVTGRNPERLASASKLNMNTSPVDSCDRKALDAFFNDHGAVDHLVISLGGSKGMGNFTGLSMELLREGFDEKFWPQLETLQAALPMLSSGASITFVTGSAARLKQLGIAGLTAINGALELMLPSLSLELTSFRVNAVSPGVVDTPWWNFLPSDQKPDAFAQFTANTPAKRAAQPEEIADVISFLAGNAYMTGKVIGVDGGMV